MKLSPFCINVAMETALESKCEQKSAQTEKKLQNKRKTVKPNIWTFFSP